MSEKIGSLYYDIDANDNKLRRTLDANDARISKFGDSFDRVGRRVALAFAAVGAAAVGFGISAVKAFQESEDAIAQTNAVLKSTGGIAGVTSEQIDELATSLQKVTKFSDEEIRSAENMLLTFTNISKDIFPETTKTVLDMSQALGQDLKSSSIQLGKALNNPIDGISALQRVGVKFTDSQKEQIETLVESGKTMEAQKIILKELATEFGGSAEAAGKTFGGKMAILKNQINDVQESIGKVIIDAIAPLGERLAAFVASDEFQAWLEKAQAWLAVNIPKAIDKVIEVAQMLWPVIQAVGKAFGEVVQFLIDHQWVFWAIVTVLGAIKLGLMLNGALQAFTTVIQGCIGMYSVLAGIIATPLVMPAIAVGAALLAIHEVIDAANDMYDAINAAKRSAADLAATQTINRAQTEALLRNGTPEQKERARKVLASNAFGNNARGTDFWRGGLTWVGEQGAELIDLPRGAKVHNANDSRRMAGRSSVIVNIGTVQDRADADYIIDRVDRNMERVAQGLSPA